MKRISTLLFLCVLAFNSKAQTEKDFNEFGKIVFRQLTSTQRVDSIPIIRMREMKKFLKNHIQDTNTLKKEIYYKDAAYGELYVEYQKSVISLFKSYETAIKKGVKMEYLDIYFEPLSKYKDTYNITLSFIYSTTQIQNEVQLSFEVAWYNNLFVFLGPIKENF